MESETSSTCSPTQLDEIRAARACSSPTRRPTCEAMEALMFTAAPVLDKGFIRVVDYMGGDASVVQAARVSYGRGTRKTSDDRSLIRYLLRRRHTTPFEMAEIVLHVRAPIFVMRQWIRTRMASVNEVSARYSVLEKEFYSPAPEAVAEQSATNRQGRGEPADAERAAAVIQALRDDAERCYDSYLRMLNETESGEVLDPTRRGVSREVARITLPVGVYTQFYWKIDLWNLLRFLSLRAEPHAQLEIRAYAHVIREIVRAWAPAVSEAFDDYMLGAATLSSQAMSLIAAALARGDGPIDPAAHGLAGRELDELIACLPALADRISRP